jgi:hypothetical protein
MDSGLAAMRQSGMTERKRRAILVFDCAGRG